MISLRSRRSLLKFASVVFPVSAMNPLRLFGFESAKGENSNDAAGNLPMPDIFPAQRPSLRVKWSWFRTATWQGCGSWWKRVRLWRERPGTGVRRLESALGAASHVGNRPIAEYLISKGARPSLFSATMLGQLDVVKAFITAQPGVQRIRGPHSISLLAHARNGGEAARPVFEYLQSLKDADADPPFLLRKPTSRDSPEHMSSAR